MEDDNKRRKEDAWHIGKAIDLSHIITTIVLVVGGTLYVGTMKTDIEVLKSQQFDDRVVITEIRTDIKEIKQLLWDIRADKPATN